MVRPSDLDPKAVSRQFGRRARRPVGSDFLLREVERRMLERLDVVKRVPATVLDAGCGLGHGAAGLQQRYPQALVLGVDIAPPAAAVSAARHGRRARQSLAGRLQSWFGASAAPGGHPMFVAADTLQLPLRDASVDLVWSNLAWHWFADPPAVLGEWYRAIRPEGLLMFSAFGVDTLRELRALGATLPEFPDMHDIGDAVAAAGFAEPVMDTERLTITWSEPAALLAEVRALGGNASRARARGLQGRGRHQHWIEALETLRGPDGRLSLSVEVAYGHAWCPPRKRLPEGWAPVDFRPRRPHGA
jgi:malonyl-CoA O-methyltransferase